MVLMAGPLVPRMFVQGHGEELSQGRTGWEEARGIQLVRMPLGWHRMLPHLRATT